MGNFGEDSDDSDGEGGLGNVSRIIMRPPGHSGKAKRGHLCFDASFESGNLGRVDLINETEYDLFIRPDTCSPKLRFWFNFTVDNVKQDQRVIFNIVNISKERNLFMGNMTPLVKSTSRPKWQRIPKKFVFYHKSLLHRSHYILSFAFGFDKEDDVYHFCQALPYSYTRLQTFLSVMEKKSAQLNESFHRECLTNSVQKRKLDLITIGSLSELKSRRLIAIMARVHPGESPGSLVCQGLLELLISSSSIASILKKHIVFKIIPMMNPDGVFLGNYRSNAMGTDLNRSWHIANSWCHPTIKAVLSMMSSLDKSQDLQIDFILDIHASASLNGCFIYGNTYNDVYRYERHILFPKLLSNSDDYSSDNMMFNSDSSKNGTARRYLCSTLSASVNCYTFEVSVYGYKLKGSNIIIPYTEESYMKCGRNLLQTIFEYYRNTGVIALEIPTEIFKKKLKPRFRRMKKRRNKYYDSWTPRSHAPVHFQTLNMNYDSETSVEDPGSTLRHSSSRRTFERRRDQRNISTHGDFDYGYMNNVQPKTFVVYPPTISIIDFNVISRNDLERFCALNK